MFCNIEYWQIIVLVLSKGPWDLPSVWWLCFYLKNLCAWKQSTTPFFGPLSTSPPNLLFSWLPSLTWREVLWKIQRSFIHCPKLSSLADNPSVTAPFPPTHLLSDHLNLSWFWQAIWAKQRSVPTWLLLQLSLFFILYESQLGLSRGSTFLFL